MKFKVLIKRQQKYFCKSKTAYLLSIDKNYCTILKGLYFDQCNMITSRF